MILLGLGILYLALAFRIVVFIAAYTLLPLAMGLWLFDIGPFRSLRSLTDITGELTIGPTAGRGPQSRYLRGCRVGESLPQRRR